MAKVHGFVGKHGQHEKSVTSTHQIVTEMVAKTNPPEGFCFTTDYQSGGRGQIGRKWHSEAGKNLLVSYIFYPKNLPVNEQFLLNVWVSLAVAETIESFGISQVWIKWPNDVYIGLKKVAGILIQNTLQANEIRNSVVSIGVNVNQTAFPADLPNPTSFKAETGHRFETGEVLSILHEKLETGYRQLHDFQYHDQLRTMYEARLFGRQAWYLYIREDGTSFRGRVREVMPDGHLVLDVQGSVAEKFSFRQVSWVGE